MSRPRLRDMDHAKVMVRFTGAAGGSHYVVHGKIILRPGESITVPLEGHWAALVASGDAEVVNE